MTEEKSPQEFEEIGTRLDALRKRREGEAGATREPGLPLERGAGVGYRVVGELLGGMIFGAEVGWLLDRAFGTKPWFMVVLFLMGAAAGLLSAYRAMMRQDGVGGDESRPGDPGGDAETK